MTAIQQAAANTVLRIANLFEQNCALKHGLPKVGGPDRVGANIENNSEKVSVSRIETTTDTVTDSPSPGEGAAAVSPNEPSSLWRRAAPFLLTGAAAGLPSLWFARQAATTPQAIPSPPPAAATVESVQDGSLLQFLQDRGYHLPGGEPWQTK